MTVSEQLDLIIEGLRLDSGYPYPVGHQEPDQTRPLAYGLVMGHLLALKKEWERRDASR